MNHIEFIPATEAYFISRRRFIIPSLKPFLTFFDMHELSVSRLYVSEECNSLVGYAINPDSELFNLFNNSGVRGLGKHAIIDAIERGANNLLCFDGKLPKLYAQYGFVITDVQCWNDHYAPENWNYKKYGHPNVIQMRIQ